jgi:hypothetical protein
MSDSKPTPFTCPVCGTTFEITDENFPVYSNGRMCCINCIGTPSDRLFDGAKQLLGKIRQEKRLTKKENNDGNF